MGGYIGNFIVYTMAMIGLICFAFFVYKKFSDGSILNRADNKFLDIESTLYINPRKSLQIVRAGSERFLIASDVDSTTLISKLNSSQVLNPISGGISTTNEIDKFFTNNNDYKIPDKKEVLDDQKIHLEPIKGKNTSQRKLAGIPLDDNLVYMEQKKRGRNSLTMKEMAKKINNL